MPQFLLLCVSCVYLWGLVSGEGLEGLDHDSSGVYELLTPK